MVVSESEPRDSSPVAVSNLASSDDCWDDEETKPTQEVEKASLLVVSSRNPAPSEAEHGETYIKWASLGILLFQNAGTNLIMPLAQRTQWNSQSGVINQELIKGVASVGALLWGGGSENLAAALRPTAEALKTSLPAIFFLIQNNMQYVAAKHLDPTSFAVLYQLKILATAVLSVLLLKKQISCMQWLALLLLLSGAVTVVLGHARAGHDKQAGSGDLYVGVAAVLCSCLLSGCAGVYFEKLLKGSSVTLAARNLQLSGYSLIVGLITFYQSGGDLAHFWEGYTPAVWVSIINNAVGGLLVAAVIKYADNIAKNFANTLAIIGTSVVHWMFFGGALGPETLLGVALVVSAIFLYSGLCTGRGRNGLTGRASPVISGSEALESSGFQRRLSEGSQIGEKSSFVSDAGNETPVTSPTAQTVGAAAV